MRADRAAVATAKFNLDNTIIRAPIAGKTGSLLVRRGNLVRSGGADAARRDQPGAADLRAVRDSVVAAGAGAPIRRRRAGCRSRPSPAASRRRRRRSIRSPPRRWRNPVQDAPAGSGGRMVAGSGGPASGRRRERRRSAANGGWPASVRRRPGGERRPSNGNGARRSRFGARPRGDGAARTASGAIRAAGNASAIADGQALVHRQRGRHERPRPCSSRRRSTTATAACGRASSRRPRCICSIRKARSSCRRRRS